MAIWCLGNISGDNVHFRDNILGEGACAKISRRLDGAPPGCSFVRNASWTLSNFCKGRPSADLTLVRPCLPVLSKILVENSSEEILTDIVWGFSYYTDAGDDQLLAEVVQCNILPRLI